VIWETNRGVLGHTKEWKNPFLLPLLLPPTKLNRNLLHNISCTNAA